MSLRGDQHHVSPFRSAPSPATALIMPRTRAIIETIIILIGGSRHVSLYKIPDRDFVLLGLASGATRRR
jgi:hypothetical protein